MTAQRFDTSHVAVVTGAARGIGLGIATHLAGQGLTVALLDRDGAALDDAISGLAAKGHAAIGAVVNLTDSKEALEVASRENASSQKSVFELRDAIQQIARHDKAEESREFAGRVQTSLHTFAARTYPGIRNRGVKKAPFWVLIGATMPSVLAEMPPRSAL